jgi:hypothetical protein
MANANAAMTIFTTATAFQIATCLLLWLTGRALYFDGVVFFLFHGRNNVSIVPDTTGLGVNIWLLAIIILFSASAITGGYWLYQRALS